jgi:hypothetical protein
VLRFTAAALENSTAVPKMLRLRTPHLRFRG